LKSWSSASGSARGDLRLELSEQQEGLARLLDLAGAGGLSAEPGQERVVDVLTDAVVGQAQVAVVGVHQVVDVDDRLPLRAVGQRARVSGDERLNLRERDLHQLAAEVLDQRHPERRPPRRGLGRRGDELQRVIVFHRGRPRNQPAVEDPAYARIDQGTAAAQPRLGQC
jgi:hypothetical protein